MKKRFIPTLTLFLPLFLLYSCGKSFEYKYLDDSTLPYIERNGDLFAKHESSYQACTKVSDAATIEERVNNGEQTFLFLYQEGCSSCERIQKSFVSFVEESKAEVFSFRDFFIDMQKSTIINILKTGGIDTSSLGTPSVFFIYNKTDIRDYREIYAHANSSYDVWEYLSPAINLPETYNFTSYSAFQTFSQDNECLAFVNGDDNAEAWYSINIFSIAVHHQKKVAYLDWSNMNAQDKVSVTTAFGTNSVSIIEKGGSVKQNINFINDEDGAIAIIDGYFIA